MILQSPESIFRGFFYPFRFKREELKGAAGKGREASTIKALCVFFVVFPLCPLWFLLLQYFPNSIIPFCLYSNIPTFIFQYPFNDYE